ncbi:MAG: tyrosinase family protein [Nocardiopsaceae bacterium]|nr:tyrosinase family protein [Nocardiopsaceae bacterium]
MNAGNQLRIRRSLTDLQQDYAEGRKKPLEDLMRAWKGIKELPPGDPRSFFVLGGYHGEPFRGAGWGNNAYWGGYCQHGNVLFPIWHRIYLYKLEDALRSIPGCEEVTLPFWDECDEDSRAHGIPSALTDDTFELDGQTIPNPLKSYTFPVNVVDHIGGDNPNYSKPSGYETVRYPYSGLVGTAEDRANTEKHNKQWTYAQSVPVLNKNIVAWLNQNVVIGGVTVSTGVYQAYADSLAAPNYTVFSNTTSAANWNDNAPRMAVPLESPHNRIHLAVGGFDVPGEFDASPITGANGDMGENDTAGLDPIFFFHHCFVDRVFWLWQKKHGATGDLPVIDGYPGTNSADSQGATPGIPPNAWLSMDTPLAPFTRGAEGEQRLYTGRDGFDIERQLGYTYGPGSLDDLATAPAASAASAAASGRSDAGPAEPRVHVTGINRGNISGSFVITAFADIDGERKPIGAEAVLSRWHTDGCANCQTHLLAGAAFSLHGLPAEQARDTLQVEVRTHAGLLGGRPHTLRAIFGGEEHPRFRVEVRL